MKNTLTNRTKMNKSFFTDFVSFFNKIGKIVGKICNFSLIKLPWPLGLSWRLHGLTLTNPNPSWTNP